MLLYRYRNRATDASGDEDPLQAKKPTFLSERHRATIKVTDVNDQADVRSLPIRVTPMPTGLRSPMRITRVENMIALADDNDEANVTYSADGTRRNSMLT